MDARTPSNRSAVHYPRSLPHLRQDGALYFVTFRLADALPRSKLERIADGEHMRWSKRREQHLLDTGAGACYLAKPGIAAIVANALQYFDGQRYELFSWCIMPNHVHVVLRPLHDHTLSTILHTWKSFTAKEANKLLKRQGPFWQRDAYDHAVRDAHDLLRIVAYVRDNPAKAGLVGWEWVRVYEDRLPV